MESPHPRFPERTDEISDQSARLKISLKEKGGTSEIEIKGNRKGLRSLAAICSGLAELASEDLRTPANHYHLDEDFWGTDKGSVPLLVWCSEDGWPEIN